MRLRFGECTFDGETGELLRDGRRVAVSPRAFQLLRRLLEARPHPLSLSDLGTELWPESGGSESELAALVLELRGAVEARGGKDAFLRTVGAGTYAFAGRADPDRRPTVPGGGYQFRLLWDDREIPLAEGENVIGRDYDSLVRIDSPRVSRRHARITIEDGRVHLEDLGSRNGTRLNDKPVGGTSRLADGDRISIGSYLLVFREG
ncbi:MAG TPA: FHA domain-containing protein [Thermoanaerobaculia bacterium]